MVVRQQMHGEVAAKRGVAVAAVTADAGNLGRALIEVHVVGLVSIGCGIGTGDRNVDRRVDRDIEIDEAAGEMAVAADACTVVACRYDVRTDQSLNERGQPRVTADRDIAVAATPADAGHLKGGLIEFHIVRLVSLGVRIVSRHGDIDRVIQCE